MSIPMKASRIVRDGGLLLALLLGWVSAEAASAREPRFPPPPAVRVEWVSNSLSWNGVELGIRKFESNDRVAEIAEFYKKRWARGADGQPGYREAFAAPWLILSRLDGDSLLAVQVQAAPGGGSWGYLSVSDLPALARGEGSVDRVKSSFPVMRGSQMVNDMTARDPGKTGRVLSLTNAFSLAGNVTFYRDHYEASGWAKQVDQRYGPGHTLVFSDHGKQVHIVIRPEGSGSAVVANEVELER